MDAILQDIRYAFRALRRAPGFTAVAIATLALGIGANTAVFSVLNAVALRPLPFPDPERVVNLGWVFGDARNQNISPLKFSYIREQSRVFEGVATYRHFTAEGPPGSPDAGFQGLRVSEDFFRVLGTQPARGRAFAPEEERPGGPAVVVLSDEAWRTHFGGAPEVLGGEISLDGVPHTIVGIMPPGFVVPQAPDHAGFLRPLRLVVDPDDKGHNYLAIARLRSGVTPQQAQADLDRVFQRLSEEHPAHVGSGRESIAMLSFQEVYVGDLGRLLWILLGAIGVVLLIACANVANLLLARATERQREISVRLALGAGRWRLVQQLLTESLIIALVAGVVAVGIAAWGVAALLELSPTALPRQEEISMDARVLAFTFLVATLTGIVFGLAAGLPATRPGVAAALREGGRAAGASRGVGRVRTGLVVVEAALAVVLLAGAGLLISTFANLRTVDTGFRADDLLAVSFPRTPPELQSAEAHAVFSRRAVEDLARLPGVASVATTSVIPFVSQFNLPMTVDGRPEATENDIQFRSISPAYFRTLDVPVLRGRAFSDADRAGSPPVIIINEATAKRYFPDEDPIGQRIHLFTAAGVVLIPDLDEPVREIVGVVADVRELGLRQNAYRTVYVPQEQTAAELSQMPAVLVRTARPAEVARALPAAMQGLDPRLPTPRVRPMQEIIGLSFAAERFVGTLLSVFAAIALLLTAVGIYGVISYTARQRTREIGVRLALGATPGNVLRLVTRQGMAPVLIGLLAGSLAAAYATRLLAGLLYGVSAGDPLVLGGVSLLLAAVALLASYLPARRATRVDPMTALRTD